MAYEMKAGNGSAFKNEKKEDWHADMRGKVVLPDGKTHFLDVWEKQDRNGNTFVSIKIGKEVQGRSDTPTKLRENLSSVDRWVTGFPQDLKDMKDDILW